MDVETAINERHSVRRFKTIKKPDYRDIIAAIEAASKAPLAGNAYAVKYVLVRDKEKIKALSVAAQQEFFENVHFVLVVCSDKKDLESNYYERAKIYSRQQAGAAIENFTLRLLELGLATCWVGAFADDTVKRILRIPENIDVEAILPIGYEMGKAKQQRKPELDFVIFYDTWKNKYMDERRMVRSTKA